MTTYQGHLSDGSSVQKHSAGGLYPYVIYAQNDSAGVLNYGVKTPEGDWILAGYYDTACQLALDMKEARSQRTH